MTQNNQKKQIPDYFLCQISYNLMKEPYLAADGYSYEYETIKEYFKKGHTTSPITQNKLDNTYIRQNKALKSAIQDYLSKNQSTQIKQLSQQINQLRQRLHLKDIELKQVKKNQEANSTQKNLVNPQVQQLKQKLTNQQKKNINLEEKIKELTQKVQKQQQNSKELEIRNLQLKNKVQSLQKNKVIQDKQQNKQSQHQQLEIMEKNLWKLAQTNLWQSILLYVQNGNKLSNMKRLDLNYSNLQSMIMFECLTNLEQLNLFSNKISKIQGLQRMKQLKSINLISNQIKKIQNLDNLPCLTNVLLSSNPIAKTQQNKQAIQRLKNKNVSMDINM